MAKTKTSQKRSHSSKSTRPKSVRLKVSAPTVAYDPTASLQRTDEVLQALAECIVTADFEAFKEIIVGYFEARNISEELEKAKIPRRTFYNAMSPSGNPSLSLIAKLMRIIAGKSERKATSRKRAS